MAQGNQDHVTSWGLYCFQDAGEQRPDHYPEAEAAELDATDQEADRESQEDRQVRVLLQGPYDIVHAAVSPPATSTSSSPT
jgi:hypothetical protein